jgi:Castor and Pollux, part of voltage-gated ion channel
VIKTILALTNNPNRRRRPYHIVSRIHDPENLSVARMVADGEAELVPVDDLLARITAQTCRQSGLSVVYTDLLNFGGDEIYFATNPASPARPSAKPSPPTTSARSSGSVKRTAGSS